MLPAYVLVRVLNVQMEKRAEPLVDGTHALLSVESSDVSLFTRISQYFCIKRKQQRYGTLNTSALDRTASQKQTCVFYVVNGADLVRSVRP